jgi:hypothetical protein
LIKESAGKELTLMGNDLKRDCIQQHLLAASILSCFCLLLCLPVLLHPHWGLYSDPRQIVENCRIFYSSPHIRWDIIHGYYRPGFHILDLAVWLVSKENPLGFYVFRTAIFICTALLTYASCYTWTQSKKMSATLAAMWGFLSPTFEVIYTLDKAESYIAFLFSAVVYAYVQAVSNTKAEAALRTRLSSAAITFGGSAYAMFTKETGQLLLLLGLLFCVSSIVDFVRTRSSGQQSNQQMLLWLLTCGLLPAAALVIYKAYFIIGGGSRASYGALSLSPSFVLTQLLSYLPLIPDFFAVLLFVLCATAIYAFKYWKSPGEQARKFQLVICLELAACAGTIALLCWKSLIVYSWYPMFAFLIPSVAFFASTIKRTWIAYSLIACFALAAMPSRIVQAQLQYQFDAAANDLVDHIAAPECNSARSFGIPFLRPEYAEVVEEIESLTLGKMIANHIEQPRNELEKPPRSFFNFVNYGFPEGISVPEMTSPLTTAKNSKLAFSKASSYEDCPCVEKYSYWSNDGTNKNWVVDNIRPGDVLMIPYGDLPPSFTAFRGLGMFCTDWRIKIPFLPQASLKEQFRLQRKIFQLAGHRYTMGWIVLAISDIPKMSWFIDRAGNLKDGAKIFTAGELHNCKLETLVGLSQAMLVSQLEQNNDKPVPARLEENHLVSLQFTVPPPGEKGYCTSTLHLKRCFTGDEPLFLHVEQAKILTNAKP